MTDYKPFAFVLMPFSHNFSDIYKFGIKSTAEDHKIIAERVDEQHFSETILERIYRQIENSDFIIAEMSGQNPNVFYEVGYAHAKGKTCILITQNATDIPFDLKHHPHVIYDGSIEDLKIKLSPKLEWIKQETKKKKFETITAKLKAGSGLLEKEEFWHYGTFELTLDLKNNSNQRSPEIEAIYIKTTTDWSLHSKKTECPSDINNSEKLKRHLITPSLRRLSPDAFTQEKIKFRKRLWSKFSGEEEKEEYSSKGIITVEVVTSEGTLSYENLIEVNFVEVPF